MKGRAAVRGIGIAGVCDLKRCRFQVTSVACEKAQGSTISLRTAYLDCMAYFMTPLRLLLCAAFFLFPAVLWAADAERFVGTFIGEATFESDGETRRRDMSTTIQTTRDGFQLSWTSVTYKDIGRTTEKTYTINFTPSDRPNIYQSAMAQNLFGQSRPLDPLKGEPFVWARFEGDTLSVFSLFINETGNYEVQEFHRTLVEDGLDLVFLRIRNGMVEREIRTLLERQAE